MAPKPTPLHQRVAARLATLLDAQLPDQLCALPDVEVVIVAQGPATVRAPDVLIVPTSLAEANPPRLAAQDVVLAVKVLSPGTMRTDRVMKMVEYAQAGIHNYWIIDLAGGVCLSVFVLGEKAQELLGEMTGVVDLVPPAAPAPLRLDLPALLARR